MLATVACAARAEDAAKSVTPEHLLGIYKIVASENSGKPVPAERIDGTIVRFTKDTVVVTDTNKREMYAATYVVDPTQTPARISMVSTTPDYKGVQATGLIERDGKTTRLIYQLPGGKEEPTEFKTRPGQILVIMEKIAEE
jgi:uncharacterized protein (TIGR03067 family)